MSDDRWVPRADIEVAGSWRADSARWRTPAHGHSESLGDVETEELNEREGLPDSPRRGRSYRSIARRWRLSSWLRQSGR